MTRSGNRVYQNPVRARQRCVNGPFGEVGYILKTRKWSKDREKLLQKRVDFRILKREKFLQDYQEKLDLIKVHSAAQRVVQLGLEEEEKGLERRKNKLKRVLLEDESKYVSEYTYKAQTTFERNAEKARVKAEVIMKKNLISDNEHSQKMYERLALEKDDEFQRMIRLRNLKCISDARKMQIHEREKARIQEENDDRIWNEISEEFIKAENVKKEQEKRLKHEKREELSKSLSKQIESQQKLMQNLKCLEELEEIERRKIQQQQIDEYNQRQTMQKNNRIMQNQILKRQIAEKERNAEIKKQQDIEIERILLDDEMMKIRRADAEKVDSRMQSWAELCLFKEASEQFKAGLAEESVKADRLAAERKKVDDAKYLAEMHMRDVKSKKFSLTCAEITKLMATEKAAKEAENRKLDAKYNELLAIKREFNEQLDKRKYLTDPSLMIPVHNQEHEKYLSVLQQRQRLEDEEMMEKIRNSRNEMQKKIREAIGKPLPEIMGTSLHPFYSYIKAKAS